MADVEQGPPVPPVNLPTRREAYTTLLEAVVRSSDDAIITKNLQSIITSWNPAATRMFGFEAEEIVGKSILTLIPPELQHEEVEVIKRLKAGEQVRHYETTRVRKNGERIQVSLTISPLLDATGRIVGASKIARDVTQQRASDRARLQLASIVESSEDAIISKDLEGKILTWNHAAETLFGYRREEIIGKSILTLIPPDLHHEEPGIMARLKAGERIEHFESVRVKKNGELMDVSLSISPIRDAAGQVIGASKILRDISDRKRMQMSLLQAEKLAATGRMAASIAHEINNPLEGLLNLIYLARHSDSFEEIRSLLSTAEGELARVAHIAKQTLGYYRENVSAVRLSLGDLLKEAVRVYQPRLRAARIEVRCDVQQVPSIIAKRGELMQVISNLLANSMHAMPSGGVLTLRILPCDRAGEPGALIQVQDTGTGISDENIKRIFEPFFTTRSTIGTGIGLWVARQFIEAHGGTIDVESSTAPENHGTSMSIWLPIRSSVELIQ